MPLGYAVGSIAGVTLEDANNTPCKVLLVDVGNFRPTTAASTRFAADGTPITQILTITAGRAFGVRVEFLPPDVLSDVIDAINAAIEGGSSFSVSLMDDLTTIDENCLPDFAAGWLKVESQRTNPQTVKGVDFRFLTSGD